MCTVSDKLKLCTCGVDANEIYNMPNYWVFYKYDKHKSENIIGEIMMPMYLNPINHKYNLGQLLKLLNEGNVFDFEIKIKHKDRLFLSLSLSDEEGKMRRIDYGFEFRNDRWVDKEFCGLEWANKYNNMDCGIIENTIEE
jgi:hypothetical protein